MITIIPSPMEYLKAFGVMFVAGALVASGCVCMGTRMCRRIPPFVR